MNAEYDVISDVIECMEFHQHYTDNVLLYMEDLHIHGRVWEQKNVTYKNEWVHAMGISVAIKGHELGLYGKKLDMYGQVCTFGSVLAALISLCVYQLHRILPE
jgi:hypothetical protein